MLKYILGLLKHLFNRSVSLGAKIDNLSVIDKKAKIYCNVESADELGGLVADIFDNRQKYLDYGIKAKAFYDDCRKPVDMANGLWSAIQYVLKK